jgi:uncharacterized protein
MIKEKEFPNRHHNRKNMMERAEILKALKEYKKESSEKYGILKIGIFGSAARGTVTEHSDLDIVVNLLEQDLFSLIGIKQELEEHFHSKVDVVSYRLKMDPFLKKRIDQEAVYV